MQIVFIIARSSAAPLYSGQGINIPITNTVHTLLEILTTLTN